MPEALQMARRPLCAGTGQKRAARRRLKVFTGRRQTEWTGATQVQKLDELDNGEETLING
jgi:hypothetical protein